MYRLFCQFCVGVLLAVCLAPCALAQRAFTWREIRDKFEATNPTLRAGQIGIAESRAQEITANLRPNPDVTGTLDQFDPFPDPLGNAPYRPLGYVLPFVSASYLHDSQPRSLQNGRKGGRHSAGLALLKLDKRAISPQ